MDWIADSIMYWPEITPKTTLKEVKHIHRMIWQYVAATGHKPDTPYTANCACCEYCIIHDLECSKCPIKWTEKITNRCGDPDSLYQSWKTAEDYVLKTQLAEQIRDIPFKFEKGKETESNNKISATEPLVATINKFLNDVHGDIQIRKMRSATNLMIVLYAYMKELGYSNKDILEIIDEEIKNPQQFRL